MRTTLLFVVLLMTNFSQASTYIVQNTNDSGTGSLRSEISNAANGDTIRFNPSMISSGSATINLTSEIAFSKSLTIIGVYNNSDSLYIKGSAACRVFGISNTTNVTLDSLILSDGSGVGNLFSAMAGGAIIFYESDTLFIRNSIVRNNNCLFAGAISVRSENTPTCLVVKSSTFSNNVSTGGGAIMSYSAYSTSNILVSNSTFRSNSATDIGGGLYSEGLGSFITIENSTFLYNNANEGGGVYSLGYSQGSVTNVTNSTFVSNTANFGGAIWNDAFSPPRMVYVGSSIVSSNEIYGYGNAISSNGYNIFTYPPNGSVATDVVNALEASIGLQPLAYNGGNTQTMLPGPGSIAIDMGNPSDMSDAQNKQISGGRRDVGAAETTCLANASTFNESLCFGESVVINGTIYDENNLTGTEVFQAVGPNSCDSVVTVDLTIAAPLDLSTNLNGISISSNQAGASYQWIECNGNTAIAGATDSTFTATSNGDYAVIVTVGNCSDTSECVTVSNVGLEDFTNVDFSIYPNPTTGETTIILKAFESNSTIELFNSVGQKVFNQEVVSNTSIIDLSAFQAGIYFVSIHSGEAVHTEKLIKQ